MQQRGIVHPSLLDRVQPNFYPSLCTIQLPDAIRDSVGQLIADPLALDGHVDIPCRISPRGAREVRTENQVYVNATHHVALGGYYPDITEAMSAVVDGVRYDIEGVEWDGNQIATRLYVRLIDRGETS